MAAYNTQRASGQAYYSGFASFFKYLSDSDGYEHAIEQGRV